MGRSATTWLVICGAVLALIGLITLAIPVFTTQHTKDVARIGNLKVQTTQHESYAVPPYVSGGAVILGALLIGAGFYQRR